MIASRRFLPSINSLLALEAVDRLGSATAAAAELALTHSAVSRQLKVLEQQIGVTMFIREGRGLRLTPAGQTYAISVRESLQDLARASLKLKANGTRSSINLAVLPTLAMYWLSPRLHGFGRKHPEILVNQVTRIAPFDFNREKLDAAIHFGMRDWQGVNYLPLLQERVIPVYAPSLCPRAPLDAADIAKLPLLHLESRPTAWEHWFDHQGLTADQTGGMLFDQFSTMAEAAAAGMGVALLPEFLAEAQTMRSRLVRAYPDYLDVDGTYFLVWPKDQVPSTGFARLLEFLQTG